METIARVYKATGSCVKGKAFGCPVLERWWISWSPGFNVGLRVPLGFRVLRVPFKVPLGFRRL